MVNLHDKLDTDYERQSLDDLSTVEELIHYVQQEFSAFIDFAIIYDEQQKRTIIENRLDSGKHRLNIRDSQHRDELIGEAIEKDDIFYRIKNQVNNTEIEAFGGFGDLVTDIRETLCNI